MTRPFIIFALPRSRTKWLSEWLAYDGRKVGHDIAIECATPDEFLERLSGLAGTVETSAMLAWRLLRSRLPNARFMTVRRPVEDVRASFARFGITPQPDELEERDAMLDALEDDLARNGRDFFRVRFDQLGDEIIRCALFHELTGVLLPLHHDIRFRRNIQIDLPARMAYLAANQDRIQNLKRTVREQEQALCRTFA